MPLRTLLWIMFGRNPGLLIYRSDRPNVKSFANVNTPVIGVFGFPPWLIPGSVINSNEKLPVAKCS